MNQEDFIDFFSKLLVETEKIEDSDTLFSLHKSNQDQSPISESTPPPPTQDQADTPFEEAVPLEDELAHLLDDIDD